MRYVRMWEDRKRTGIQWRLPLCTCATRCKFPHLTSCLHLNCPHIFNRKTGVSYNAASPQIINNIIVRLVYSDVTLIDIVTFDNLLFLCHPPQCTTCYAHHIIHPTLFWVHHSIKTKSRFVYTTVHSNGMTSFWDARTPLTCFVSLPKMNPRLNYYFITFFFTVNLIRLLGPPPRRPPPYVHTCTRRPRLSPPH